MTPTPLSLVGITTPRVIDEDATVYRRLRISKRLVSTASTCNLAKRDETCQPAKMSRSATPRCCRSTGGIVVEFALLAALKGPRTATVLLKWSSTTDGPPTARKLLHSKSLKAETTDSCTFASVKFKVLLRGAHC